MNRYKKEKKVVEIWREKINRPILDDNEFRRTARKYEEALEKYCNELEQELFFANEQKKFVQQVRDEACSKLDKIYEAFDNACNALAELDEIHYHDHFTKNKEQWKERFLEEVE